MAKVRNVPTNPIINQGAARESASADIKRVRTANARSPSVPRLSHRAHITMGANNIMSMRDAIASPKRIPETHDTFGLTSVAAYDIEAMPSSQESLQDFEIPAN